VLDSGSQSEPVADADAAPTGLAGRELDDRFRSACRRRPPGRNAFRDLQDLSVSTEEDDVDREAHEERVHRRGGPEKESFPALQPAPSEQPAHPSQRRGSHPTPREDDAIVRRPELNRFHKRPSMDRDDHEREGRLCRPGALSAVGVV
jgi:hypothetical protein